MKTKPTKCARVLTLAATWLALATTPALAQVSFLGSYSQDFNTLPASGTPTWSNNTTLVGWYAYGSGVAGTSGSRDGGTVNPTFTVDTGTSTSGGLHSYGSAALPADRALGSVGSGGASAGDIVFALVLQNTGTQTYSGFTLAFTGEQWRNGGNTTPHKLDGDFTVVSTFTPTTTIPANVVAGYTNPTNIDFTGPIATGTAAAVDGNNSSNRVLFSTSQTATWAPGQYLIVRWWDDNDSGNDHGLAIDDLTLNGIACDAPAITDDPEAANVCAGSSAMFSVTATGTAPLSYQWRKNGVDIGGATSSSYTIASVTAGDAGSYDCVVTNACGNATSMPAALAVQEHATVYAGINQTICETDQVSVSGSATNASSTLWTTSGDGAFADATMPSTTYTAGSGDLSAGAVTLTFTAQDSSPCMSSASDSLTVGIIEPAFADAGADLSICETNTVVLSGSYSPGDVLWTSSGDGTFDDSSSCCPIYTPGSGDISAGTVDLTLTATPPPPCATTASDTLTVTIAAGPTANAGVDQTVCSGDTVSLGGTATNQNGVNWTTNGDGAFDDAGSLTAIYTPGSGDISSGSVDLTLTSTAISPCTTDATDTLTVTISAGAVVDAGMDQSICSGSTVSVNGTITNGTNAAWTTSGDGSFDNASSASAIYTPGAGDVSAGTVTLTLTADANSPCTGAASDSLTVSIASGALVDAGADQSICSGDTVSLAGSVTGGSNPLWTTSGDGAFDDATSLTAIYTPGASDVSSGMVTLTLTADSAAPCASANDSLNVSIAAGPMVSAGMDQSICDGDSVSLSGSVTNGSNASWSTSGNGTFDDATSLTAIYTPGSGDASAGTVTLTLSADANSPCTGSTSDSLTVTIAAGPTVDAGMDQSVCGESVNVSASITNGANSMWSTSGDGTFADATAASTSYTPGPGDISAGTVTLTITADAIAPCTGTASDSLTISVAAGPTIAAGDDYSICAGDAAPLSATAANASNLMWTTAGDGTFADATSASTTYTPGPTDISSGSVTLTVSVDATSPCTGTVSDSIVITISAGPTVDGGMDQSVCSGDSVSLSGSVTAGTNAMWTTSGDGTFADASMASTSYTPGAGDLTAGTVTLTLAADAIAPCVGNASDSLTITIAAGPSLAAGDDYSICAGDTATLSATAANASNLMWTTAGDGTFADATAASTTYTPGPTDITAGSVTLTVSVDATSPCTGTVSDTIVITIAAGPTVDAGMDQSVCSGDSVSLSGSVTAGTNAMWSTSGDGTFADASMASTSYTPGAGDLTAGTVTLTLAADAIAPCVGSTADSLIVTLAAGPAVDAGMDQSICGGSASLSGSVTNGTNILWTTSGDGTFGDASMAATTYSPGPADLTAGTVTLTLSADAIAPCIGSVSDSLDVTITEGPMVAAGMDQSICAIDFATLAGNVTSGSNTTWTTSGDGSFADASMASTTYTPGSGDISAGTVTLTFSADAIAPCTGTVSDALVLTISSGPMVNAGMDQSICSSDTVSLSGSVTGGTNTLWSTSGDGSFANAGSLSTTYTPGANDMLLGSVMLTLSADAISPCTGSASDSLTVTLDAAPAISSQPMDVDIYVGQSAGFTVVASGTGPLTYQWRKDGSNLSNGPRITGATTATLGINPTQPSDAANYDCVITGPCGMVTSDVAELRFLEGCPNSQPGCVNSDIYPAASPDCVVNISDLGVVLANYAPGVPGKTRAQGDIWPLGGVGDGYVDLSDLGQVLADFGTDCR